MLYSYFWLFNLGILLLIWGVGVPRFRSFKRRAARAKCEAGGDITMFKGTMFLATVLQMFAFTQHLPGVEVTSVSIARDIFWGLEGLFPFLVLRLSNNLVGFKESQQRERHRLMIDAMQALQRGVIARPHIFDAIEAGMVRADGNGYALTLDGIQFLELLEGRDKRQNG